MITARSGHSIGAPVEVGHRFLEGGARAYAARKEGKVYDDDPDRAHRQYSAAP